MDDEADSRQKMRDEGPPEDSAEPPHHQLSNPASDPDPTEWPDPYDRREDPLDEPDGEGGRRAHPGALSTSEPHPRQDPQAPDALAPERDHQDR